MNGMDANHMFRGVIYNQLATAPLRNAMRTKIEALRNKIEDRQRRIRETCDRYKLSPLDVAEIEAQYRRDRDRGVERASYSNSPRERSQGTAPVDSVAVEAGVVAQLLTERNAIHEESEQVSRMTLIVDRLSDTVWAHNPTTGETISRAAVHTLTDDEFRYLGLDKSTGT